MWKKNLFQCACTLLILAGVAQAGMAGYNSQRHQKQKEMLAQERAAAGASWNKEAEGGDAAPEIMGKYAALYEWNQDLAGWLSIDGMVIDYPVMQCGDDEYYLNHSFGREEDRYGTLYVKGKADVNTPGTNIIIYGHNMRDGAMFGDLDKYRDKDFGLEHSVISFDTLYEERTYEIVAVFLSRVYYQDEDIFKYYEFYQAEDEEEFSCFYDNIKKMALYDTGVTAGYGDTFITLTTCAYHVEDGRLAVVAKRIH